MKAVKRILALLLCLLLLVAAAACAKTENDPSVRRAVGVRIRGGR